MRIQILALGLLVACSATEFGGNTKPAQQTAATGGGGKGLADDGDDEDYDNDKDGSRGGRFDDKGRVKVPVGETTDVPDDGEDRGKIVSATGGDDEIATIDPETGKIEGKKVGKTTIEVEYEDGTVKTIKVEVTDDGGKLGSEGDTSNGGSGAGGDKDAEGLTVEEGEIVANLPGVKVVRVGVNFEDLGFQPDKSDNDYNDAVLCFKGNFKVDGSSVVSIKNQQVIGSTHSISGCDHKIRVEVVHKDGTREPAINFDSSAGDQVTMNFKVGSKLEVYMNPYKGCNPGVERNMHGPQHCKVEPDVCRTTGN